MILFYTTSPGFEFRTNTLSGMTDKRDGQTFARAIPVSRPQVQACKRNPVQFSFRRFDLFISHIIEGLSFIDFFSEEAYSYERAPFVVKIAFMTRLKKRISISGWISETRARACCLVVKSEARLLRSTPSLMSRVATSEKRARTRFQKLHLEYRISYTVVVSTSLL